MRLNTLNYMKRFNNGNWEHEEISVGIMVEDGESASEVLKQAMSFVLTKGETDLPLTMISGTPEPKAAPAKKAAKVKEEVVKAEPKVEAAKEEVAKAEPKVEPKADSTPEPAKEVEKKATRVKETPYDRANELHKKLVAEFLDTAHKGWKSNAAKAVAVSTKMAGKPFLNSEGSIIKEFKEAFSAEMAK